MFETKIDEYHTDLIIFEFYRIFRPQPFPKHYPTWLAQENGNLHYHEVNQSILQNESFIKNEHIFIYFERKMELYQTRGKEIMRYFDTDTITDLLYENCEMYFFNKTLKWCIVVMDHPNERQALIRLLFRDLNSMFYPNQEIEEHLLIEILNSLNRNKREKIVLTRKYIQKIPTMIRRLRNVIHLDLSYNWIEILPDDIMLLPLRVLKISANPLRELPSNLSKIGNTLQELHLSGIKQSNFNWELIGSLDNLQKLYIPYNGLTEIPPEILQLKKLKILDISFNYIKDFRATYNLKKLENIYILGNSLS